MYGKRGAKLERKRDAHHQLVVELRRHLLDRRTFSTPRMPQSHHLHMFWRGNYMVVKVILDDRQIDPAYVWKPHVGARPPMRGCEAISVNARSSCCLTAFGAAVR